MGRTTILVWCAAASISPSKTWPSAESNETTTRICKQSHPNSREQEQEGVPRTFQQSLRVKVRCTPASQGTRHNPIQRRVSSSIQRIQRQLPACQQLRTSDDERL